MAHYPSHDASFVRSRRVAQAVANQHGRQEAEVQIQDAVDDGRTGPEEDLSSWLYWGDNAAEAADLVRVPERWRLVYIAAYEKAARKFTIAYANANSFEQRIAI